MDLNLQIDKWGMITRDQDGGDSCNRTFAYLIAQSWQGQPDPDWYHRTIMQLTYWSFPGIHRRHLDTTKWYSMWNRESRDQTIPLLIAAGEYGDWIVVLQYILSHALRALLFTTNTRINGSMPGMPTYKWKCPDLTGPDFWSLEIRALPKWIGMMLYPLLCALDIYTLGSAVFLRWFKKSQNDVINHVLLSICAERRLPTVWSWIMNRFVNKAADLQTRMDNFFGTDPLQPKMHEVFRPLITKYFRG